jgi:hypothetical protein
MFLYIDVINLFALLQYLKIEIRKRKEFIAINIISCTIYAVIKDSFSQYDKSLPTLSCTTKL